MPELAASPILPDAIVADVVTPGPIAANSGFEPPRHVAIIMDGNGRWAAERGLPRSEGHRRGVEALRRTVRAAGEMGIAHPDDLLVQLGELVAPGGRNPRSHGLAAPLHPQRPCRASSTTMCGSASSASATASTREIRRLLEEAEELTRDNTGLLLVVAFNYGGRQEIARAARARRRAGRSREAVAVRHHGGSSSAGISTRPTCRIPDLIIRTSGEQRLSNFLMWQSAYSELVFVPTYWPDFERATLEKAIAEYRRRERRFGGLVARTGS